MNQLTRRSLLALIGAAPAGATYAGALGGGDARRLAGIPRTADMSSALQTGVEVATRGILDSTIKTTAFIRKGRGHPILRVELTDVKPARTTFSPPLWAYEFDVLNFPVERGTFYKVGEGDPVLFAPSADGDIVGSAWDLLSEAMQKDLAVDVAIYAERDGEMWETVMAAKVVRSTAMFSAAITRFELQPVHSVTPKRIDPLPEGFAPPAWS